MPFFGSHFLLVFALYLFPLSPLCLKRLEVLFCCCVVLFCLFSVGNALFYSEAHQRVRDRGCLQENRNSFFFFLRRVWDATPALFLENTHVIRDAGDLKIPSFLMITFNMHRKTFFTDSGRLSTEWRSQLVQRAAEFFKVYQSCNTGLYTVLPSPHAFCAKEMGQLYKFNIHRIHLQSQCGLHNYIRKHQCIISSSADAPLNSKYKSSTVYILFVLALHNPSLHGQPAPLWYRCCNQPQCPSPRHLSCKQSF